MPELRIRLTASDVELWVDDRNLLVEVKRDGRMVLRHLVEHVGQEFYYPALADALFADRIGNRTDILKHAVMELRLQLEGYLQSDAAGTGKRIWKLTDRLDAPAFCLQKTSQNSICLSRCDIKIEREEANREEHSLRTDGSDAQRPAGGDNQPASSMSPPRLTLPPRYDRFYGREPEIATLTGMLTGPQPARLVTITGTAGVGKTRLVIETVERLSATLIGPACFVSLTEICEPERVVEAARDALGLERTGNPNPLQQIAAALGDLPALLILDNYEQLLPAGAQIVPLLLAAAPGLQLLVTSRHPLQLHIERELPLLPLPVVEEGQRKEETGRKGKREIGQRFGLSRPSSASLLSSPSVQLFVDRAQARRPGFSLTEGNADAVATLCQRLDGLPLAIELAAARSGTVTPAEMLELLEDRFRLLVSRYADKPTRHRSLQAAIDSSYEALPPELQDLFAQLSVFRGGWTLAAAAAICEVPSPLDAAVAAFSPSVPQRLDALDALNELRDRSLVIAEEEDGVIRFRLLESLREFGAEQLMAEEQRALRQRHADYFLALIDTAAPHMGTVTMAEWLDRLEADLDNLRAALDWTLEAGQVEAHLIAVTRLARLWQVRGYLTEGRTRTARALEAAPEPSLQRANALTMMAFMASHQDDNRVALAYSEEAMALMRHYGEPRQLAFALLQYGQLIFHLNDGVRAGEALRESLDRYEQIGDERGMANALHSLGTVTVRRGDFAAARDYYQRSLALRETLQDRQGMAFSLQMIGYILLQKNDTRGARYHQECAMTLFQELGDQRHVESARILQGGIAYRAGDMAQAEACFVQALETCRTIPAPIYVGIAQMDLCHLRRRQQDTAAARAAGREALMLLREIDNKEHLLWAVEAAACLAQAEGENERAVWLLGAVSAARETLNMPATPYERAETEPCLEAARNALAPADFTALWEAGRKHTLSEAVATALYERPLFADPTEA